MDGIFRKTKVNDLDFALSTLSQKNRVIARNIANADTPFYKSSKIEFSEVMAEYMGQGSAKPLYTTHEKHMQVGSTPPDIEGFIRRQNNPSLRTDMNDVNLDYEMSEQAGTSILFSMLSEIAGNKFGGLKSVISGRS